MIRSRHAIPFLYALFFLSGGAGLGYQMVWSRMLTAGLGHEMPAMLAVVGAFMGGMAIGAWVLDHRIARSPQPGRWYAALELLIGLWGWLSTALIPLLNQAAARLIGLEPSPLRHWGVAFVLPWLLLLPATAAMGATLPAMERFLAPRTAYGRCVGALYAANTAGAVSGILGCAFVMIPAIGLRQSAWVLAATNLFCGLAMLLLGPRLSSAAAAIQTRKSSENARPFRTAVDAALEAGCAPGIAEPVSGTRLGITIFFTGLLGIGFETVSVRALSQVLENTVYTFAAVLAVFLSGMSVGAALYQRWGRRAASRSLLADLLGALSLSCLLAVIAASYAPAIYQYCRATLGDSGIGVLAAEMTVASAVVLAPTIFMGATFAHLVQAAAGKVGQAPRILTEGRVGRAVALNTLGGGVASALFLFFLPLLGSKWTLVLIGIGYLSLLPQFAEWRWGFVIGAAGLIFALPAKLQMLRVPPEARVTRFLEGVMASVAVVEDARGDRVLRVDNRFQMGGTAAAAAEYRHAHIPLLLHPSPRHALFLGLGTGITFGAATLHPLLQSDGVELVPEVVQVMREFEPCNLAPDRQPPLKIFVADARRFVRSANATYDVIVADLFHPARDGAGSLYTLEHFQAIRRRLSPGGLFCQWLPLHQLDEDMLRVITRTFLEVFPNAQAWLLRFNVDAPVLGLVGSLESPRYTTQWVEQRLSDAGLARELRKLALADSIRLFGNLLVGSRGLRELSANAPLNTDDRPRVAFGAPRFVVQQGATPYGRLLTLLKLGAPNPSEVIGLDSAADADQFATRLTRYWNARKIYLTGLVEEAQGRQARAIDLFVECARLSDDFTMGYAQCLTLASALARTRPAEARALLERLIEAQPSRPVAKEMLERLFDK